jgi:hypothetical protein
MGTQWHFIHHKDLLEARTIAWQKNNIMFTKKGHRVYIIKNSVEFYPS